MVTAKEKEEEDIKFMKYLEEEKQLAPTSIETYWSYYRNLPVEINQDTFTKFIIKHKNNFAVRGFAKAYNKHKGTNYELPDKSTGRKKQRIIRPISNEDIKEITDTLYAHNFQYGLIFDIIEQGALRISEALTIYINSFEWQEWLKDPTKMGRLHIIGKGNKERVVLINPETMQKMIEQLAIRMPFATFDFIINQKEKLFNQIYKRQVYRIINQSSNEIIKRGIRPHELRHNRATELMKRGVDIRDIKEYLGHSSIATTEIYLHTDANESLKKIENNLLNKK